MHSRYFFSFILFVGLSLASSCSKKSQSSYSDRRPNILIAISDDQSFAHTSYAGAAWIETPAFDRVAREGIYMANCYAGSPGCAPSRSSLVTGRYHWQNEQAGQHASGWPEKYVPLVDVLKANGYHTGGTGKGVGPFQYGDAGLRTEDAAGRLYNDIRYEDDGDDERIASGIGRVNYAANFIKFMSERKPGEPFYFWYGAVEPHRGYEKDSWKKRGKKAEDVEVPGFLPDVSEVRGDMLDYAVEIEWFDMHLERMLRYLDDIGELDNTIVIVTGDNGMPFPRAKANGYDYGVHVPMAIRYRDRFPGNRQITSPVSFVDLAPTLLELLGLPADAMLPMAGQSLVKALESKEAGVLADIRNFALFGRERHSASRYRNLGYPVRGIRKGDYLLLWNIKPERWPAGAPQRLKPGSDDLLPLYGINEQGKHTSDHAFTDIDAGPTKSFIVENYANPEFRKYFDWSFALRPEYELFNLEKDPFCLQNLSGLKEYRDVEDNLKKVLLESLKDSGDPRVTGDDPEVFESYPRYGHMREFPER